MGTTNRAEFLRGNFSGQSRTLRPPWALPESGFVDRCTRCGDCLTACPQRILEKGRGGFPQVNFTWGECTFCGDCLRACAAGAFAVTPQQTASHAPWSARAAIDSGCLAMRGVECRSCGDQCTAAVIRFRLVVGGSAMPELDAVACTGCGACFAVCPVQAINIRETSPGRGMQV